VRIVYLSGNAIPSRAANTVHVMNMCAAFAELGHDVTLLSGGHGDEAALRDSDPFEYYNLKPSFRILHLPRYPHPGNEYPWGVRAALRARRLRPDVVYGRSLLGCYYAAKFGLLTVYEAHRPDTEHKRGKIKRAARLLRSPQLLRLVVLSQALAERFKADFSFPHEKLLVAYNGARDPARGAAVNDNAAGSPSASSGAAHEGGLKVAYVGSFFPGKGIETVLPLVERCPWAQFYIAGGKPEEVAALRGGAAGRAGNLTVLGHLSQEQVAALRESMDVLLVPAQRQVAVSADRTIDQAYAPPLKLYESLAAAKAVVGSDFLGEVVTHGKDALLCDPKNIDDWVAALESLRNDPALLSALAAGAAERFQAGLSWNSRAALVLSGIVYLGRVVYLAPECAVVLLGRVVYLAPECAVKGRIALYLRDLRGGGAQRVFVNLCRGFLDAGYEVDMVCARAQGALLEQLPDGVELVNLQARGALAAVPRLRRYLKRRQPDVLLSSIHYVNVSALLAARCCGRLPVRLVVREANVLSAETFRPGRLYDRVLLALMRRLYPRADRVVVNSEDSRDSLALYGVVARAAIELIPNPLDCAGIQSAAEQTPEHPWLPPEPRRGDAAPVVRRADAAVTPRRADAEATRFPPVVIGVGSLSRQKNFSLLIRAFAEARANPSCADACLIILGEGEQRPELETLVTQLGLQDAVSLAGFAANPYAFMARAELFVLSSLWEGSANVVAEALACGAPVVATDCPGGARELLEVPAGAAGAAEGRGRYGRMVPSDNCQALAGAITLSLTEPEPGARARARVRAATFDLPNITHQYLTALGLTD